MSVKCLPVSLFQALEDTKTLLVSNVMLSNKSNEKLLPLYTYLEIYSCRSDYYTI